MAFPLENKLVVAVASSALFDLTESDDVYRSKSLEAYRAFQRSHLDNPFRKGVAFPFIRRLLGLNRLYPNERPVEVIFLSHNDADTGMRLYRSAQYYGLDITRGAFLSGGSPYKYIPAFDAALFLSANPTDVLEAVRAGHPAGTVLPGVVEDDETETVLRIAFDFDGVLADDEAERVFAESGDLGVFHASELGKRALPHHPGPLKKLLDKISRFQRIESVQSRRRSGYQPALRIAIITARNAPSNERVVTTLESWGIRVDETFFLGGIEKRRILEVLRPHIYFDDHLVHLTPSSAVVPSVHIPFGIRNLTQPASVPAPVPNSD
jgi:5'-nucleotidase